MAWFKSLLISEPHTKTEVSVSAVVLHAVERAGDEPDNLVAICIFVLAGWLPVDVFMRLERALRISLCEVAEVDVGADVHSGGDKAAHRGVPDARRVCAVIVCAPDLREPLGTDARLADAVTLRLTEQSTILVPVGRSLRLIFCAHSNMPWISFLSAGPHTAWMASSSSESFSFEAGVQGFVPFACCPPELRMLSDDVVRRCAPRCCGGIGGDSRST